MYLTVRHPQGFPVWGISILKDLCVHRIVTKKSRYTRVYPKVSGLAIRSENCKLYSSLPLGAVVSLFCKSV
jgi:hypothetical protein